MRLKHFCDVDVGDEFFWGGDKYLKTAGTHARLNAVQLTGHNRGVRVGMGPQVILDS